MDRLYCKRRLYVIGMRSRYSNSAVTLLEHSVGFKVLYREIAGGVSNLRKRHVNVFGRHFEWKRSQVEWKR